MLRPGFFTGDVFDDFFDFPFFDDKQEKQMYLMTFLTFHFLMINRRNGRQPIV